MKPPLESFINPQTTRPSLDSFSQAKSDLSHSQLTIDKLRMESRQAELQAQQAAKPATITKETTKGTIGTLFDPFIKAGRTAVQAVGEAFGAKEPVEQYTNIKGEPTQTLQADVAEGKSVPRAAGEFALEAATVAPIGKGLSLAKEGIVKGVEVATPPIKAVLKKTGIADFFANRAAKKEFEKSFSFAQDFTSRPINKGVGVEAIKGGSRGYTPPTTFKRGKIISSNHDNRVAEASMPYIKKEAGDQINIDSMKQAQSQINLAVKEMIANNKVPFNETQLRAKLSMAKEESRLLFAGDTTTEKAYDAVTDEFVNFVNKGKKDTSGLFESRQAFDQYIQTKIPNAFKKDATGQFLDPRDNIRVNALLDVRRAANEYVAELLPPNSPFAKSLKDESYLLEGIGRVATKLYEKGIFDKTNLQILVDEYPILKWVIGSVAGGGLILGGAIVGSSD